MKASFPTEHMYTSYIDYNTELLMLEFINNTLNTLGYVGIVLLMFFPFTLSEIVMPLVGFMTIQGKFLFAGVVVAGTFGAVIGTLPFYYLGKLFSERQLKAWGDTHGKWLMLSANDIERAEEWFNRHGTKAVFLCRLVPGVRLNSSGHYEHESCDIFILLNPWLRSLGSASHILGTTTRRKL